jgi:hypothetical protein
MKRFAAGCLALSCALVPLGSALAADGPGALFPVPFTIEHVLVQTDADGTAFRTDSVTDTYGSSHLVSVRPGGSRVIVDFARSEISEVSVEKSTYWTLSFSQMADLSRRLAKADERPERPALARPRPASVAAPAVKVEEVDAGRERQPLSAAGPAARAGARHLRAFVENGPSADIWADGTVRLTPAALRAIEGFERDVLGAASKEDVSMHVLAAAARRAVGGAVLVRVRRPLGAGGTSDDTALSLTPLAAFPQKLLVVGDGFRRVPSPLEVMVDFAEGEALRDSSRLVK